MIKTDVGVEEFVVFMNNLLEVDPDFVKSLVGFRTPCDTGLVEHPTVQVGWLGDDFHIAGFIGVMNGFFGVYDDGKLEGHGAFAAVYDGVTLKGFKLQTNTAKERPRPGQPAPPEKD